MRLRALWVIVAGALLVYAALSAVTVRHVLGRSRDDEARFVSSARRFFGRHIDIGPGSASAHVHALHVPDTAARVYDHEASADLLPLGTGAGIHGGYGVPRLRSSGVPRSLVPSNVSDPRDVGAGGTAVPRSSPTSSALLLSNSPAAEQEDTKRASVAHPLVVDASHSHTSISSSIATRLRHIPASMNAELAGHARNVSRAQSTPVQWQNAPVATHSQQVLVGVAKGVAKRMSRLQVGTTRSRSSIATRDSATAGSVTGSSNAGSSPVPSSSRPVSNSRADDAAPRAAVVYLLRTSDVSVTHLCTSLKLLRLHFTAQYTYPVLVFHEATLSRAQKNELFACYRASQVLAQVLAQVRSDSDQTELPLQFVTFDLLAELFPPALRSRPAVMQAISSKFGSAQGAGYRAMCHFFFERVFSHPMVREMQLEYIMRLDSDSRLESPIRYDVFDVMREKGLVYAYRAASEDPPPVIQGLWQAAYDYATKRQLDPSRTGGVGWSCHSGQPAPGLRPQLTSPGSSSEALSAQVQGPLATSSRMDGSPSLETESSVRSVHSLRTAFRCGAVANHTSIAVSHDDAERDPDGHLSPAWDLPFAWPRQHEFDAVSMPIVYNNFEVTRVSFFRDHVGVNSFKRFVLDSQGIYTKRWGDAPLRWLSLQLYAEPTSVWRMCDWDYAHGHFSFPREAGCTVSV